MRFIEYFLNARYVDENCGLKMYDMCPSHIRNLANHVPYACYQHQIRDMEIFGRQIEIFEESIRWYRSSAF